MDSTDQFPPGIHGRVSLYAKQLADDIGLLLSWDEVEDGLEDVVCSMTENASPKTALARFVLEHGFTNDWVRTFETYLGQVQEARAYRQGTRLREAYWDMDGDESFRDRLGTVHERHADVIEKQIEEEQLREQLALDYDRIYGLKRLLGEKLEPFDTLTQATILGALRNDRKKPHIREMLRPALGGYKHPAYERFSEAIKTFADKHSMTKKEELVALDLLAPKDY